MAEDITTLQAQLDALKAARRSGVRTTTFGERSITHATDKEMVAAIAALESEIAAMAGAPRPRSVTAMNQGARVYWDVAGKNIVATPATGRCIAGAVTETAGSAATSVRVRLDGTSVLVA